MHPQIKLFIEHWFLAGHEYVYTDKQMEGGDAVVFNAWPIAEEVFK